MSHYASQNVLTFILGGGQGARLYPLTKYRSKPAVPIAGKYRLIDIPISNCLNSGFNRVFVLTQFLSVSLHDHLAHTYKLDPFAPGFVRVLAAQQSNGQASWYLGTADAIRQNLQHLETDPCDHVLVLAGDQIYRMDYRDLLKTHLETAADVTLALVPVERQRIGGFGVAQVNPRLRITGFVEKPQTDHAAAPAMLSAQTRTQLGLGRQEFLANMGVYLFKRQTLSDLLASTAALDFGHEIFPSVVARLHLQGHVFNHFWEDLGTIKAFHDVHMALVGDNPPFTFNAAGGTVFTRMRFLPASHMQGCTVDSCLISDGCQIGRGARLQRAVVGVRSQIGRNVELRDTVMIGADSYDAGIAGRDGPPMGIGDDSVIQGAILDKDCRIGRGVRLVNADRVSQFDGDSCCIRDGIIVVPRGSAIPDGFVI